MMASENEKKLNDNLLLFFTGIQRTAGDIEAEKLKKLKKNASSMRLINEAVNEALSMLVSKNLKMESFGKLMHESWLIKRSLSNGVSNYRIDQAYEKARSLGAIGGKILGAGGGGFMLLFAHPSKHKSIVEELKPYVHVPFQFEKNGSTIALYQPGGLCADIMKNVMIAGGTGMIGRACTRLLKERKGYKVFAPKRAEVDLSDRYALLAFMKEKKITTVIFAAGRVGGIIANRDFPASFLDENAMLALNGMWAAKRPMLNVWLYLVHLVCIPSTDVSRFQKMHFSPEF